MLLDEGSSDIMNNNNDNNNDTTADAEPSNAALTPTTTSAGTTGNPGGGGGGVGNASVMSPAEFVHHDLPDTKEGIEELCPVCGDKVSGYHYGLLTCESCKGFFKRTVQNKKVYTCVAERSCHIDKSQRKRCPYCRFQKCLEVGMKLEAVRADRMRGGRNKFGPMYKRDRARKLQLLRQKQMAAQQARASCQMGNEVVGSIPTSAGVNASLSYSPSGGPGTPLYGSPSGNGVQIKQELIQIPQLSSSTSSPDSSPSPLPNTALCGTTGSISNGPVGPAGISMVHSSPAGTHHQSHPHHSSHQSQAQTAPSSEHHKLSWTPHTPTTPTSSTPSPHTNASPKAFQYDVAAVGQASGSNATSANSSTATLVGKIPAVIREIQCSAIDDKEWQSQLFGLLNNQTYNQCEVDLFELMCKVLDQSLFAQVDWARNSIFFKDLKVDDQMKLLQNAWSDMLILDHVHQRLHNNLPDETTLPNGQKFNLLSLAVLGVTSMMEQFNDLRCKLQELKFDSIDYICLKFMLLLNPEVRLLVNRKHIYDALEQVKQGLLEYNLSCYPHIQDKYGKLLTLLPEIHQMSHRGEEYLYYKHLGGGAPTQTLLMEMLHAKKK